MEKDAAEQEGVLLEDEKHVLIQKQNDQIIHLEEVRSQLGGIVRDLKLKLKDSKKQYKDELSRVKQNLTELEKYKSESKKNSFRIQELEILLKDKDQQINAVMLEGANLSKKQNDMEDSILKMKTSLKDKENIIEKYEEKIKTQQDVQFELKNKLDSSSLSEKERLEGLSFLTAQCESLEKKLKESAIKYNALEDDNQMLKNTNTSLKEAYEELQVENSVLLEKVIQADHEKNKVLASNVYIEAQENRFVSNIADLQEELNNAKTTYKSKLQVLHAEINTLRKNLDASEMRNQELSSSVPEATRPLQRQITSLNATLRNRSNAWEALEKELRAELKEMTEKKSLAELQYSELLIEFNRLKVNCNEKDAQYMMLKSKMLHNINTSEEKSRLTNALEDQILEYKHLSERMARELEDSNSLIDELKQLNNKEVEQLKLSAKELESRLLNERQLRLQTQEKFNKLSRLGGRSYVPDEDGINNDASLQPKVVIEDAERRSKSEASALRKHLRDVENIRDSLTEELVLIKTDNRKLQMERTKLSVLERNMMDLNIRYDTALDVIGSKEEELEELRADLVDVKELFRTQVSGLLDQIENLQNKIT